MNWYDLISPLYDISGTSWVYRPMRQETIRQLRLAPGQTVLDVACGTGLNFGLILEGIGPAGTLIGVDYSAGMLRKARQRVRRQGWDKNRVYLIQADARTLSWDLLDSALPVKVTRIDRVLCTLGLSVVPDWEVVFARSFDLLAAGGRYAIMDGYLEKPGLMARIAEVIFAGDATRRFWEPLQGRSQDYEERTFPFFLGSRIFVVSGTKPESVI